MRKKTVASRLAVTAASVALAAMAPACGGSNPQGFSTDPDGGGASQSSSSGGGGSSSGGTGSSSGAIGLVGDGSAGMTSSNGSDAGCAGVSAKATATEEPVYMLFILDGSESMSEDSKWTSVTAALTDIFNDMASKNDPGLAAGLIVFSDDNDQTQGSGPYPETGIDVPIARST